VRPIVKVSPAWREGARLLTAACQAEEEACRLALLQDAKGASSWLTIAAYLAGVAAVKVREAGDVLNAPPTDGGADSAP